MILNNDIAPELDDSGDIIVESQNIDCLSGDIAVERTAVDDCNNPLLWNYIMRDSDNNLVAQADTNVVVGEFAVGHYTIEWTVTDGCGNFDYDLQNLEIRNIKTPSPICMQGLSASLVLMDLDNDGQPDAEMVELFAEFFDGGSFHSCNNPFVISLSQDTSVTSIVYDCDSIGIQTIQLWVTDVVTGAQDYCETFVDIQDNNGDNVCDPDANSVDVVGEIFTEVLEEVEGVEVGLGIDDVFDMTDEDGVYAFANMPLGGSYNILPEKDVDYLNGVSTLDLILIQRHILGLEKLNSPYKMIAADVNSNKEVSAIDLVELRKLVLGIYNDLPDNQSWRFVDAEHDFIDPTDPWYEILPESYQINQLSSDMEIDFIGVKIGDVNGSVIANSNLDGPSVERRAKQDLLFLVNNVVLEAGESATLEIRSNNYQQISGWQGTLEFNPGLVEVLEISSGELDIESSVNSNMEKERKGKVALSYAYKEVQSFKAEEVLFTIRVRAKEGINTSNLFDFGSTMVNSEAYYGYNTIQNIRFGIDELIQNRILSVNPNPWITSTNIQFTMSETGKAEDLIIQCDGEGNVQEILDWIQQGGNMNVTEDCGAISITSNFPGIDDSSPTPDYPPVTFYATDDCGNSSSSVAEIEFIDTIAPTIIRDAKNIFFIYDPAAGNGDDDDDEYGIFSEILDSIDNWLAINGGALAIDQCSPGEWTNNYQTVTESMVPHFQEVTFTINDLKSAQTTSTGTITIITPGNDTTVECDGLGNTTELNDWLSTNAGTMVTGFCDGPVWVNNFSGLSDDCGATGSAVVVFDASDSCGNTAQTIASFTIEDTTPPSIDTPASDITIDCDAASPVQIFDWLDNAGNAVASDICGTVTWSNNFDAIGGVCNNMICAYTNIDSENFESG